MIETDFLPMEPLTPQEMDRSGVPVSLPDKPSLPGMVAALEKRMISETLQKYRWNRTLTAAALEIDRKTLYNKIKAFQLDQPTSRNPY
jgi:DNA-binding NtrC family response regulator